ncbi:MAG: hypothetical protein HXX11_16970 [Desulfuromonadales bacterium]|nr:hypothetical protein [Desulfuromonadales bacterium]
MKFKLSIAVIMVMAMLGTGCGVKMQSSSLKLMVPEQERTFAGALEFLKAGKEQQARESLDKVVAAPSITGITDEALFRLALLYIRDEAGRMPARTQSLLERLENEFPRSIWTRQAAPLVSYLASIKFPRDKQRELKTLKDLNLSLSRDNRELRQTIERLKSLDIELEQKIKR